MKSSKLSCHFYWQVNILLAFTVSQRLILSLMTITNFTDGWQCKRSVMNVYESWHNFFLRRLNKQITAVLIFIPIIEHLLHANNRSGYEGISCLCKWQIRCVLVHVCICSYTLLWTGVWYFPLPWRHCLTRDKLLPRKEHLSFSCFPAPGVSGKGYKRGSKAAMKRREGRRKKRPEQEKEGNRLKIWLKESTVRKE